MGNWIIYQQRHLELLQALSERKNEWSPLKAIQGGSPHSDRDRLSELIDRDDVTMRLVKTTRGGWRYEYQITSAGERILKEAQS